MWPWSSSPSTLEPANLCGPGVLACGATRAAELLSVTKHKLASFTATIHRQCPCSAALYKLSWNLYRCLTGGRLETRPCTTGGWASQLDSCGTDTVLCQCAAPCAPASSPRRRGCWALRRRGARRPGHCGVPDGPPRRARRAAESVGNSLRSRSSFRHPRHINPPSIVDCRSSCISCCLPLCARRST